MVDEENKGQTLLSVRGSIVLLEGIMGALSHSKGLTNASTPIPCEENGQTSLCYLAFFFFYSYVHTSLGSFLPPAPTPSIPGRNYFALISNFAEERV
jgi:hypothetical protein